MSDIQKTIQDQISSHDVVLYMKGTPMFPQCGFSSAVAGVLKELGVDVFAVNVLEDAEIREGIKAYTNWPTIPQLYVKGEFIGGCDIVMTLHEQGELKALFSD